MKSLKQRWVWIAVLLIGGTIWLAGRNVRTGARTGKLPETVDFNWHIRPILSDRCFACHGPDEKKRQAGLRLDTKEGAFAPADTLNGVIRYAIVPGHPEQSLLISRIFSGSPDSLMPPPDSHLNLSDFEKQLLKKWIAQGAHWKEHWAFAKPVRPELPAEKSSPWVKNPVDAFVLQKIKENDLQPNKESDKARLLRRASFVLTGLPPSPEMVEHFEQDNSPDAYEKQIDTLLASAAYGERWAMYWMDLARYSDTHGYQDDLPRTMWPWRDWVIKAFNENMPYDKFVTWQLAGDLLPDKTPESILATGFNRNHKISQEGGIIDEEYRTEYVADRTNIFGKAFLGLTLECARCHDHKYDPISTREYYSTFAFFNQQDEKGFVPNLQTPQPFMIIPAVQVAEKFPFLNYKAGFKSDRDTILEMVMHDSVGLRKTHRLIRGQYDHPGEEVRPSLPAAVLPFDTLKYTGNRRGMAGWLFDKDNPLTARVWVNRLWQEVFGRGIVATSENFGTQGSLPSHPELLDWLAVEFIESGWDMKHMLRILVCSATFRQSEEVEKEKLEYDPENIWLARSPRTRMPYEFIRDNLLVSSGLLNKEVGGPSVKPWQPPGIWEAICTEKSANGFRGEYTYVADTLPEKMHRRSLYTYQRRTVPPPSHLAFDAPMRDNCEVRRAHSNTPLQALVMLNDQQVQEAATALASSILSRGKNLEAIEQIKIAFQRILTRSPQHKEMKPLVDYYNSEFGRLSADPQSVRKLLKFGAPENQSATTAALMQTIVVIYNMDEAFVI